VSFIQIGNVTRRYDKGVTALDRVSLEIKQGEWLAIMARPDRGRPPS